MTKSNRENKRGFLAKIGGLFKSLPTILKIMSYMLPLFLITYLASNWLYALPGSIGGLIVWVLAFYFFVGFNYSLRQMDRDRIINDAFSVDTMLALSLGAIAWPFLSKGR